MRTIGIIAGLTIKETVRQKLFLVSLVVALFFFLVSLMPLLFGTHDVEIRGTNARQSVAVLMVVFMGVPMLKFFSAIEVIGLASGAISGEIERGLLAVLLPKPMARWQLVVGKWIGINLLMVCNLVFWSFLLWISLLIQTHTSYPTLFYAGLVSILFPVIYSTLTLLFSAIATPALAASLAFLFGAAAWPHAILRVFGWQFHVRALTAAGKVARYVVPMSHVEEWVVKALGPLTPSIIDPNFFRLPFTMEPPAGGLAYVAGYVLTLFLLTLVVFQRRDVG